MRKIQSARQEYMEWCRAIGVDTIEKLNSIIDEGKAIELINLCEARQERKYAEAADNIFWKSKKCKVVMMSGPSSSGKTSSSLRIAQQARVIGLNPKVIELDNYFVNREDTPRDSKGEYDYECLGAMDVKFLNEQLNDLLSGKEIEVPKFDFVNGCRVSSGKTLKLGPGDILFMEGIHALNPDLTPEIDQSRIFRIYISALSALNKNRGTKIHGSTTDKRLLRRIVRDNRTRGASPVDSILRWPSVRDGETKYIFPFEENADYVFNSSTLYDIPVLRYFADPLLRDIAEDSPAYAKARQLLDYLSHVKSLSPEEIAAIPPTSIMREFIGGQTL